MTKEQKCITKELAIELQEVAEEFGFELPKSEHCYIVNIHYSENNALIKTPDRADLFQSDKYKYILAFDTSELGEMLFPLLYEKEVEMMCFRLDEETCRVCTNKDIKDFDLPFFTAKTEANARCQMLIHLITHKLKK